MKRYRKKPVVIEAVQLQENWTEICNWINGSSENPDPKDFDRRVAYLPAGPDNDIAIRTLEGEMRANPGDWIIRGVQGEFYPCKNSIFEATYEAVES